MVSEAMLNEILSYAPAFLLVAVRALAMIEVAPLLSSDAVPQAAKISLAGLTAYASFQSAIIKDWELSSLGGSFIFLVIGEALIGLIMGFYLTLIFAVFTTAGQFFTLQMGFGASETFDPLSQIENPLMGQYLNLVAMLVFLTIGGFRELFLRGFWQGLQSIHVMSLITGRDHIVSMMLSGLSQLFFDAIVIAMPILGTLFLTSLTTGLISKAAPQINILSEGFPISIMTAFLLIHFSLPFMTAAFSRVIGFAFDNIQQLLVRISERALDTSALLSQGGFLG